MYAGLILAAGQARRFGSDKRQAVLPNGLSMLDHVMRQYRPAVDVLWVVLPPDDSFGQDLCRAHGAIAVESPLASLGMGHSLAAGVQAVLHADTAPTLHGLVIGLGDMPGVAGSHVQEICTALRQAVIRDGDEAMVVPVHQGHMGHPRGLGRGCLTALTALQGDAGARHALDWRRAQRVEIDDPGICLDVDTREDLPQ